MREEGLGVLRDIISVDRLAEMKRKALRLGVWFKALGRDERAIVVLTIRCVDKIRSAKLARIVTAILIKLKLAMESAVKRLVRTVGRSMAQKVSRIAQAWGNKSAVEWPEDRGFIQYLAVMSLNKPLQRVRGSVTDSLDLAEVKGCLDGLASELLKGRFPNVDVEPYYRLAEVYCEVTIIFGQVM